ncbi:MAG: hypothetical protein AAF502_25085 [Bacteroidota bacterium]
MRRHWLTWTILFVFLFFMSMDFWRWDDPVSLGLYNFPGWLGYLVVLSLILSLSLYFFGRFYEPDNEEEL